MLSAQARRASVSRRSSRSSLQAARSWRRMCRQAEKLSRRRRQMNEARVRSWTMSQPSEQSWNVRRQLRSPMPRQRGMRSRSLSSALPQPGPCSRNLVRWAKASPANRAAGWSCGTRFSRRAFLALPNPWKRPWRRPVARSQFQMVSCESEIPSYPCRNVRSRGRSHFLQHSPRLPPWSLTTRTSMGRLWRRNLRPRFRRPRMLAFQPHGASKSWTWSRRRRGRSSAMTEGQFS
mmetsp:Transcript_98726/g.235243  ORF Transcript_98726/g.235243 Transcript_98726/m.235243 type:complete len:234 (+) Transcript_98726:970-1671(+)